MSLNDPWWAEQTAGIIGAIVGGGGGVVFGGIGGGVGGPLAAKGKAKWLVLGIMGAGAVLGMLLALAGLAALVGFGQPYHVWYVLLMPGVVLTSVCTPLLFVLRTVYRRHEQRRLDAEGFRRA